MKHFLFASLIFLLCSCAGHTLNTGKSANILLLHTNDYHGEILGKDGIGGLAQRGGFIEEMRKANKNVLLLDAGDLNMRGNGSSFLYDWEIDIEAYNIMGYDALAFGNHDLYKKLYTIKAEMKLAKFPFLGVNVKKDGEFLGKPWIVKEYDGVRVGIFGLTVTAKKNYEAEEEGIEFSDEVEGASKAVAYLRDKEKCDIVIALTHLGVKGGWHGAAFAVAEKVSGIDLMVDGHSHTYMEKPMIVKGVPIVSAGDYGKIVGKGMIAVKNGKIAKFDWESVKMDGSFKDSPAISALTKPYKTRIETILKEPVAEVSEDFEQDFKESLAHETAAGDLLNDASMWYLNKHLGVLTDFAFTNGATMRKAPAKGQATMKDIVDFVPFENNFILVKLSGQEVIELFQYIASLPQGDRGWAQVSKDARYTIDYSKGNGELKNLTIGGKAVDPKKIYTAVTNDFITNGGGGYKIVRKNIIDTSVNLRNAVVAYMRHLKTVAPVKDGRITIINDKNILN